MGKRKVRKFVFPTIYTILVGTIIFSTIQMWNILQEAPLPDDYEYVTGTLKNDVVPTVKEEDTSVGLPFNSEKVTVVKQFYNQNGTPEEQQNSLIYYENIYMQNTGILYASDEAFDVISSLDGTVKNIKEDEILGTIVEVEYNSRLTLVYQGLKETNVKIGDQITKGDKIGISGNTKIDTEHSNCLHFEVYMDGNLMNPMDFYSMTTDQFAE